jgi:hypothetical protein
MSAADEGGLDRQPPDGTLAERIDMNAAPDTTSNRAIQQPITGYHVDDQGHWVAQLACGHNQHVRHDPPLVSRPWVLTEDGRKGMLGFLLDCKKCAE